MKKAVLLIVFIILITGFCWSIKIGGKEIPDKLQAGDSELILNGAGLRKKVVINVYAGALYLLQQDNDSEKIAAADLPMAIRMHFIYKKVEPEKLIEAWNTGFAKSDISYLQNEINTFNSCFREDAKKDDVYDIIYLPNEGTSLFINGILQGTIAGLEFKQALFNIWLSPETELPDLRKSMLGLK
jgi:hypothetical protein